MPRELVIVPFAWDETGRESPKDSSGSGSEDGKDDLNESFEILQRESSRRDPLQGISKILK